MTTMHRLDPEARSLYHHEMTAARTEPEAAVRWTHLERAHILSQADPWLHTRNHMAMLVLAVRQRDRREALGQIVRIVLAAPGSLSGRYPEGNTGRASVPLFQAMPVPDDLRAALVATDTATAGGTDG